MSTECDNLLFVPFIIYKGILVRRLSLLIAWMKFGSEQKGTEREETTI